MIFLAMLRKELMEQWRSRRLLAVAAVFLFLGFLSPLGAKLLPDLMRTLGDTGGIVIEFPTPTAQDALLQHVKSTSQIGVFLAILVTMGALAREKERGTAAMILSKPASRASFLLSKFVALTLVFGLCLALGGLACYYYTIVLFKGIGAARFVEMNLLLALFIGFYLAVTLLGSTIARGQVLAGGLGLGTVFVVAILGALPRIGDYMPTALLEWARRLMAGSAEPAWSAVAMSLAGILACLIAALAIFERQEL
jgi:ABC-2 type transport system permease protein